MPEPTTTPQPLPFVLSGNPDATSDQWPIYCNAGQAEAEIEAFLNLALENAEVTVADPHGNPVTISVRVMVVDSLAAECLRAADR